MFNATHLLPADLSGLAVCLADWQAEHPQMGVMALVPEGLAAAIPALQAQARRLNLPLVGAVFPALVVNRDLIGNAIWLGRFDQMPPHFLVTNLSASASLAAGEVDLAARPQLIAARQTGSTVFCVFDGMLSHINSLMVALCNLHQDALQWTGVNAGSETFQSIDCLFDTQHMHRNALLGLVLPASTRSAVAHGYPVSNALMRATSTEGNRIDTIDGRPALAVYQEVIHSEYGVDLTPDNFYQYGVHYPFGLVTSLDVLVRIPVALTPEGAIYCVGEVPPNSVMRLLRAPDLTDSHCVHQLTQTLAQAPTAGARPTLTTFYCAGRRMHFGDGASTELERLQTETGTRELAGALTLGEVDTANIQGLLFPRFHNAAIVCLG